MAVPQDMFGRFCKGVGREDWLTDERFSSIAGRSKHIKEIDRLVVEWVKVRTVAEVSAVLERAEVPFAPVHSIAQAAKDPHLWEREMLVEVEDQGDKTYVPGLTVKYSDTPGAIGTIPQPGDHNEEVYCGLLGYKPEDLAGWREAGVI